MLYEYLKLLSDSRQQGKVKFDLAHIVLFSIIAMCCNGYSLEHIATFIEVNFPLLKDHFSLDWEKAPGYTTIRKILLVVDESELEAIFELYTKERYTKEISSINRIDLDGKYICGSVRYAAGVPALQLVSVFAPEVSLILAHGSISGQKTNEIPIVQSLIKNLGLSGIVIGADALHCQKETLSIICATNNEALVQVKGNQSDLYKAMQMSANSIKHPSYALSHEKQSHGRKEDRECFVYDHLVSYAKASEWKQLVQFACIKRDVYRKNYLNQSLEHSYEASFYLSSQKHTPDWFLEQTRLHWAIENEEHYVRDTTFKEDRSKIKKNPLMYTILRSFAFNTLTQTKQPYRSTSQQLYANALQTLIIISYLTA